MKRTRQKPVIYIFGNPLVEGDAIPVKLFPVLAKQFPGVRFRYVDPTENWWEGEDDVVIIDTVKGIEHVMLFSSLVHFQQVRPVTPHDYDVYFDVSLLIKTGKIKHVRIIGIPFSWPML